MKSVRALIQNLRALRVGRAWPSTAFASLSDDAWFDLQLTPGNALARSGATLPSLPPESVQLRFTGLAGRDNLVEARRFYEYVRSQSGLQQLQNPKILDFGGGWGRVARFFLRDTQPDRITIADCLEDSIHWLRETRNPCKIIKNQPLPPIDGLQQEFHLIYAYSVFSHLSPEATQAWLNYLLGLLRPGGWLIITTMARPFVDYLLGDGRAALESEYRGMLPSPEVMLERYQRGEQQFYPTGGGGELASSFYGISLLPRRYFTENYGSALVDFREDVPGVNQAVVALRRAPISVTPDIASSRV